MSLTVLVTGATGFVGSHLTRALVDEGYDVRAMTRNPDDYEGLGEPVGGDVFDPSTIKGALRGVDVAYYLVHSLDDKDFERKDAEAAKAFGEAAAEAGVRQIIYLGGLGDDEGQLSAHLRSRRQVESLLGEGGVPVTVLRAAIVVGHGGISWEITRQLVKNLPAMVAPHWVGTKAQPIGLRDVIRYLVGVLDNDDAKGRVFEIGGSEVLTYRDMLRRASKIQNGRDVPVVVVPVLTPQLSSLWLALVTDVDAKTGRNLIESMNNEVVVTDDSIRQVVPIETMGYDDMVREALAARLQDKGAL
ncbi:MAG TPA: NAD(P)H-binding protein [Nocardioidaceae bacterium]|nr:NAD(P)H-binding protein [Nocardioidaceae bacterium]